MLFTASPIFERAGFQICILFNKQLKLIIKDLPASIVREYHRKNIFNMFDWQRECLSNPKVLFENANLVYCAPTSAG